jgi:DNA (cytosine-5)-methyltransferase 1
VSGLVKGAAKGYFIRIMEELRACGYRVDAKLLDAQWLGVPQARQRLIFVGVRDDLKRAPAYPRPLPYRYAVREVLTDISRVTAKGHGYFDGGDMDVDRPSPTVVASPGGAAWYGHEAHFVHDTRGQFSSGEFTDRPAPTITAGGKSSHNGAPNDYKVVTRAAYGEDNPRESSGDKPAPMIVAHGVGASVSQIDGHPLVAPALITHDPETGKDLRISGYAIGREYERLAQGEVSKKYLNLIRGNEARPSFAITATGGQVGAAGPVHATVARKFTLGELRRICSFPDDFVLTGTYEQRWERLGRAVPPVMMQHIATAVRTKILDTL